MPSSFITGFERVLDQLAALTREAPSALAQALHEEMQRTLDLSDQRVPVDRGDLKGSRFIREPVERDGHVEVVGGYTAPHALLQHEHVDWHHEVGQAKYLESSVNERLPGMSRRIAEKLNEAMRRAIDEA